MEVHHTKSVISQIRAVTRFSDMSLQTSSTCRCGHGLQNKRRRRTPPCLTVSHSPSERSSRQKIYQKYLTFFCRFRSMFFLIYLLKVCRIKTRLFKEKPFLLSIRLCFGQEIMFCQKEVRGREHETQTNQSENEEIKSRYARLKRNDVGNHRSPETELSGTNENHH